MKPAIRIRPFDNAEQLRLGSELRSSDAFVVRRCQVLLASSRGHTVQQISEEYSCSAQGVRNILHAFQEEGLAVTLSRRSNRPKTGRTACPVLAEEQRQRLREVLEQSPRAYGKERSLWTLALLAEVAKEQGISPTILSIETIRIALKRMGLHWKRAKAWINSPDPSYTRKKSVEID